MTIYGGFFSFFRGGRPPSEGHVGTDSQFIELHKDRKLIQEVNSFL